jgi:hypothetical protein
MYITIAVEVVDLGELKTKKYIFFETTKFIFKKNKKLI